MHYMNFMRCDENGCPKWIKKIMRKLKDEHGYFKKLDNYSDTEH